jgi:hypothetical protein
MVAYNLDHGSIASRRSLWTLLLVCLLAPAPAAFADAVTEWNEIADSYMPPAPPPIRNRISAMTQIAVHDALNAIEPRYAAYTAIPPANPGASPEAAVAAAAYTVLADTVPAALADTLDELYQNRIDELGACPASFPNCVVDGIATGEAAGLAILALRADDGSATPHLPYSQPVQPGVYQPTPNIAAPLFAGWALVTPFVLNSGSQFRADKSEILKLKSKTYTRDYNEVKRVGALDAETNGDRTPTQSAIARFWPAGGANLNLVARLVVAGRGLDLWEHARLFAAMDAAVSDATVVVFDTKYHYRFWRPVTAIRAAATDGNSQTAPDPVWTSYQPTPPYPEYTCGLTNNVGAGLAVLRSFFGTNALPYTLTAGGITRSFANLSQAGAEAIDARVFGGMHFRTSCVQGLKQGDNVGRYVFRHAFQPVGDSG